jgi:uncharacterized RDD family membrane protein YckC
MDKRIMQFLPLHLNGKSVYVGFWKRTIAALIDCLAILVIFHFLLPAQDSDRSGAIIFAALSSVTFAVYSIYFNKRFGGTPGKLAVGIRITMTDGERLRWSQVWRRSSVDIVLAVLFLVANVWAFVNTNAEQYAVLTKSERLHFLQTHRPSWFGSVSVFQEVWIWSELIALLFNKRKRAIHDFIAGTVVIHKEFAEQGAAPDRRETALASR